MKDRNIYISSSISFAQSTTASRVVDRTPSEFPLRESTAAYTQLIILPDGTILTRMAFNMVHTSANAAADPTELLLNARSAPIDCNCNPRPTSFSGSTNLL